MTATVAIFSGFSVAVLAGLLCGVMSIAVELSAKHPWIQWVVLFVLLWVAMSGMMYCGKP